MQPVAKENSVYKCESLSEKKKETGPDSKFRKSETKTENLTDQLGFPSWIWSPTPVFGFENYVLRYTAVSISQGVLLWF